MVDRSHGEIGVEPGPGRAEGVGGDGHVGTATSGGLNRRRLPVSTDRRRGGLGRGVGGLWAPCRLAKTSGVVPY